MSESANQLKTEFNKVYQRANEYFVNELDLMQQRVEGLPRHEMYKIERQYWLHMTAEEKEYGETIAGELVEVMAKVAIAVRQSPLLDDADQREIVKYTKMMRSALYFLRYTYWEPEAIHDEGTVLGVRHAQQTEEDVDIERAQGVFQQTYSSVVKILDLMIPDPAQASPSISVTKSGINK